MGFRVSGFRVFRVQLCGCAEWRRLWLLESKVLVHIAMVRAVLVPAGVRVSIEIPSLLTHFR